jgi:hypothetical protein
MKTTKKGNSGSDQRYFCKECVRRFRLCTSKKYKEKELVVHEYIFGKQTYRELEETYGYTKNTLKKWVETAEIPKKIHNPRHVVLVVDATFFGSWGVLVFRDARAKENLWWKFIDTEQLVYYLEGKTYLQSLGYTWDSVTCDGFPGLPRIFSDIPVQFCQFHQKQIARRYLTLNPKTEAGIALRDLLHTLTYKTKEVFAAELKEYIQKHYEFLHEYYVDTHSKKKVYVHRRIRSLLLSLKHNLPYLFTYLEYPQLHIPNTTNTIESHFSHMKDILRIHRGLSQPLKEKVLTHILLNSSIVQKRPTI